MIINYLKTGWRSLVHNKATSLINILGLSAGLTCFAFISLWVSDEWSYDKFNVNYDRIYRLIGKEKTETGILESAVSSAPMANALLNDYPEIEKATRLDLREEIITHNNQQVLQPGILIADPSLFEVFSYSLTRGNAATALREPYSLVLTASAAIKYFGPDDPMGQLLTINMYDNDGLGAKYKITGVMADPPQNAHFTFNMVASFKTVETANPNVLTVDGWGDGSYYTYVLLKKGVDYKVFSDRISLFYGKYIGDRFDSWKNIYIYTLQPLSEIHLRSRLRYEISTTGNSTQVYLFSTIGIFILLLAGINYMNLATAQAVNKARAAGIKKVVGALRSQLIFQYLLESIFIAMAAWGVSILLSTLLQPVFHQLTGKDISLVSRPGLFLSLAGTTILLGILSGTYPAFIISGFKPITVLKGSFKTGDQGVMLRKTLVVLQFAVTILLISSIAVIYTQMKYIKTKDLGYDKDPLLFIRVHGNTDVITGYEAFRNELLTSPLISGASVSNSLLGSLGSGGSETVNSTGDKMQVNTARLRVDSAYLSVYGIKMLAGRNFERSILPDSLLAVIINESAVHQFGWLDNATAINKPFRIGNQQGRVIGVVADFHFSPLQDLIGPLILYPSQARFSRITLKANVSNPDAVVAWLEKIWRKHFPSALLDYSFSDSVLASQYQAEDRFAKIFLYFSVLSLLIACLGLYGLISFTSAQRIREIGIRKVLGASIHSIAILLSRDFLKLLILAFLIATPLAWYLMSNWLNDFAYRTDLSWWMFGISGSIVLLVALITLSFRTIHAAIANPVNSLRAE